MSGNGWVRAERVSREELLAFLLPREPMCVGITSRLERETDGRIMSDGLSGHIRVTDSGKIVGAVFHTQTGLVLPVFPEDCGDDGEFLSERPRRLLPFRTHSILGTERSVKLCERFLPVPPSVRVDYYLMTAQSSDVPLIPSPEGLSILRAEPGDYSLLFKLHFEYEREEVVLDETFHHPETTMAYLKQCLTTQTTLYAGSDGVPVAKAGTNAKGFTCHQLGGIYTLPEYRSRGIASALVSRLCSLIAFEAPTVSLFVKTQNAAAIAVYRRLGFSNIDRFRISYYR